MDYRSYNTQHLHAIFLFSNLLDKQKFDLFFFFNKESRDTNSKVPLTNLGQGHE